MVDVATRRPLGGSSEGGKPKRRGKQPGLTRELVIETALAAIDEDGLEAFSLRKVAVRLGVYPTAIYWYVSSRNDLLAQTVAMLLDGLQQTPRRRSWRSYIRDLFVSFRSAVAAHPHVAPLIGTQLVSNTGIGFGFAERLLAELSRAGLRGPSLVGAFNGVIASLVGFVAQEYAAAPAEDPEWGTAMQERLLKIDRERYPILAENLPNLANQAFTLRWRSGAEAPLDDSFTLYIEMVLAGIDALLARPTETTRASG